MSWYYIHFCSQVDTAVPAPVQLHMHTPNTDTSSLSDWFNLKYLFVNVLVAYDHDSQAIASHSIKFYFNVKHLRIIRDLRLYFIFYDNVSGIILCCLIDYFSTDLGECDGKLVCVLNLKFSSIIKAL